MSTEQPIRTHRQPTSHAQQRLVEVAGIVGNKWHPVILHQLFRNEKMGFSELGSAIDDISSKMLSEGLSELEEEHGLITRRIKSSRPLRVEYSLTERGQELEPVLAAMLSWSDARAEAPTHQLESRRTSRSEGGDQ